FGHLVGDQVLREFAHVLKRSCRQDVDLVARYGGEEFIMLLPETPQEGALVVGERVRRLIESLLFCDGMIRLTTSAGVATYPDDARDYQELFERADIQLYRAKRAGRNRICAPSLELPQPSSKR
ncbi:MAG TPA: GGDEF domain-containing protein, partial [Candidatus Nitrosotenuis sp.]|nr:GGDEF domain-containing protein [Candidatus Nitrosotenuis sp.]